MVFVFGCFLAVIFGLALSLSLWVSWGCSYSAYRAWPTNRRSAWHYVAGASGMFVVALLVLWMALVTFNFVSL